ncbi:MAG: D-amino-acid transaminase [Alphaproteobacteria bacterium]|nr:D-amino-acid transaminase [Alphaproteobacteria bacterium]
MSEHHSFHDWSGRAPSGRIAYVNGRYLPHGEASVHVEDRGLQFADAIYEVWGISGGRLYDTREHFERLERSLRELAIPMPMPAEALKFVIGEVARRNRVREGLLYLQITRGTARRDHPVPAAPLRPNVIVTARPIDYRALEKRKVAGVTVRSLPDERWARCDIKSTSLLPNILAKTVARASGDYEAWLIDSDGYVTEGASTSAWIVDRDGNIVTRNLSNAILPGVTRRVILDAAAEAQLPIVERRFTLEEALAGQGAFLTAATAGVTPIIAIDGKPVGGGKVPAIIRRIGELYRLRSETRAARGI